MPIRKLKKPSDYKLFQIRTPASNEGDVEKIKEAADRLKTFWNDQNGEDSYKCHSNMILFKAMILGLQLLESEKELMLDDEAYEFKKGYLKRKYLRARGGTR